MTPHYLLQDLAFEDPDYSYFSNFDRPLFTPTVIVDSSHFASEAVEHLAIASIDYESASFRVQALFQVPLSSSYQVIFHVILNEVMLYCSKVVISSTSHVPEPYCF